MRLRTYRLTSQVAFAVIAVAGIFGILITGLVYPYFFCWACPFAVAACPIGLVEHSFVDISLGLTSGLALLFYAFGFMALFAVLFGRAFCGWACPMGFLQDATNKTGVPKKASGKLKLGDASGRLRYMKYAFLPIIPLMSYITLDLFYTNFCPVGGLTGTVPTLALYSGDWSPSNWFPVKIISLILFLLLIIIIGRGWCKFLCPIGAFLAPWNKVSGLKLRRGEKCTDCGLCEKKCPMDIKDIGVKPELECILCGRCTEACPSKSLRFDTRFSGATVRRTATWGITLALVAALLAVGVWGGGYERSEGLARMPCLGCLALNPKGGEAMFMSIAQADNPDFVLAKLASKPVFLHYRTYACKACDDMEPTIASLQTTYGDDVEFVHINLDDYPAGSPEKESYYIYDVEGTPDRPTGVPMFTIMTFDSDAASGGATPAYATFYGVLDEAVLAGSIDEALSLYRQYGTGTIQSPVFVDLFVDQACTFCPNSEEALVSLQSEGEAAFVTFVSDAPGASGAFTRYREAGYYSEFGIPALSQGHPFAVFAGGPVNRIGGSATVEDSYRADLLATTMAEKNVFVSGALSDTGSSIGIDLSIENRESQEESFLIEAFLVEKSSRWLNVRDEPIPFAFVDLVVNGTYALQPGIPENISVAWTGTDAIQYQNFRAGNLALVVVGWQGGSQAFSGIVAPEAADTIQITLDKQELAVLPGGTASAQGTLYNMLPQAAQVNVSVAAPVNWQADVSPAIIDLPASGSSTFWINVTAAGAAFGDEADIEVTSRGTVDTTLYAASALKAIVRSDVLAPEILQPEHSPAIADADQDISVYVVVGDNAGLGSVQISYFSCNDLACSATYILNMTQEGNAFTANFTPLGLDHNILHYKIIAEDTSGNQNITQWFDVELVPVIESEGMPIWLIVAALLSVCLAVVLAIELLESRKGESPRKPA